MPCRPGFSPVRKDDQAVGVTAGTVERSGPKHPRPASSATVGSFPSPSSELTSS